MEMKRKILVAGLLLAGLTLTVFAQEQAPAQGRNRQRQQGSFQQGQGGERPQWNPEQMRQRWTERIKETLGVSEEEWKVIQPRLEKVMTLSRQTSGMRMMGRGWGERPGATTMQTPTQEMTPVQKAASELEKVLANKEAKPAEITARLTALREARQKTKSQLAEAQASLKEVLTPRQEAQLVLMGILE